ncbi:MAG: right-handed parallel beta-helix repeat-containing protein [Elusimicrobia bacterium]|nr:right-handed parallel beta-helix repeat-containing protein [Elusimicrobiota bacterium]
MLRIRQAWSSVLLGILFSSFAQGSHLTLHVPEISGNDIVVATYTFHLPDFPIIFNQEGSSFTVISDGRAITLTTDNPIKVKQFGVEANLIWLHAEKIGNPTVQIMLAGLRPSVTYYPVSADPVISTFTADTNGQTQFSLDLNQPREVMWGARSGGTIVINSDGSVSPSGAPIQKAGNIYTLLADISEPVEIQRDFIVFDGNGHTISRPLSVPFGFDIGINSIFPLFVTIKNTRIVGWKNGVVLIGEGGQFINNVVDRSTVAYLSGGFNQLIQGNTIQAFTQHGVLMEFQGVFVTITNNVISTSRTLTANGITVVTNLNNLVIQNNVIAGPGVSTAFNSSNAGISLGRPTDILMNVFRENLIANNQIRGYLFNILLSAPGGFIDSVTPSATITDNTIEAGCDGNPLEVPGFGSNICVFAGVLSGVSNAATKNNVIAGPFLGHGIFLTGAGFVSGNVISNNTIIQTEGTGVTLQAHSNTVESNMVDGGAASFGISVNANNITIASNTVRNIVPSAGGAAFLIGGTGATVFRNTFASSRNGIRLGGSGTTGNTFFNNNITGNTNAVFAESPGPNTWNLPLPTGGNHWSDFTSPDSNGDGVVDQGRVIAANNVDNIPFVASDGWTDRIGPGQINNLGVIAVGTGSITLSWTATGDNGNVGTATRYQIGFATFSLSQANFSQAALAVNPPVPAVSGTVQSFILTGLAPNTTYFAAIKVFDEVSNFSLSNATSAKTVEVDITPPNMPGNFDARLFRSTTPAFANALLSWTAPGDDGDSGNIAGGTLDLRYSSATSNFNAMEFQILRTTDMAAGSTQGLLVSGLGRGTNYFFGLKIADEAGNFSAVASTSIRTFEAQPAGDLAVTTTTLLIETTYQAGTLLISTVSIAGEPAQIALRSAGLAFIGSVFDLEPVGAVFDPPAFLTMHWLDNDNNGFEDTSGIAESSITLRKFDPSGWVVVTPVIEFNTSANFITVQINSLSLYILAIPVPDANAPVVALLNPNPASKGLSQLFNGTISIIGTAEDLNFASYVLKLAAGSTFSGSFTVIGGGTLAVSSGTLGVLDTSFLAPGFYTLRLEAIDRFGNSSFVDATFFVGQPNVDLVVGDKPGLNHPQGVIADSFNQVFWVADTNNDLLRKFDTQGTLLASFSGMGNGAAKPSQPDTFNKLQGLGLDSSGNVYVADTNNSRIVKVSPLGFAIQSFGRVNPQGKFIAGSQPGAFNHPSDVKVDVSGKIYMADTNNGRVQVLGSDGGVLKIITLPLPPGTTEAQPAGVAVDPSGNIYVSDQSNSRILKFDSQGNLLLTLASSGSLPGQLDKPQGIFLSETGYLYVADRNNDRIQKFDPFGNLAAVIGGSGKDFGQFNKVTALAVDSSGNLYAADANNGRIQRFVLASVPTTVVSVPKPKRKVEHPMTQKGGRVEHPQGPKLDIPEAALPASVVSVSIQIEESLASSDTERELKKKIKNLKPVALPMDLGPEGTQFSQPVVVSVPYDPANLGGVNEDDLRLYYWNPGLKDWQIVETSKVDKTKRLVTAELSHFSYYQVMGFDPQPQDTLPPSPAADSAFRLGEVYVFPNPAVGGAKPTFHIETGIADSARILIYTISGDLVHEATLNGQPQLIDDGQGNQYAYEWSWDGRIPSGTYLYVVETKKGSETLRAKGKIYVVR